ncbi:MAG: DUF349 domain-containing protein [Cryobacterium sp.]|nr:DUF349 domain-containing protein [Cryobacterium sp.]MCO5293908.1 DUF349 domain-containing protein [Homoserinimonas sp.]MCW5944740.1 DUF349 domain-containing protein [Cryobacterium sp.]
MAQSSDSWGRVDETGTVFVRTADGERSVGQFPDATAEEALAYFEHKFVELAGQVTLLEQRVKRGAPASEVAKSVEALKAQVEGANAVGDLASLQSRLDALHGAVAELSAQQEAEHRASIEAAVAERTALVTEAEALAAQDPSKVQWKQTGIRVDELFAAWQLQQKTGPRLPKTEGNELWKRFRAARATIETQRRAFFAEMDSVHKDARTRKQELIARAEALADKGAEGIPAYRLLIEEWKGAGRSGKKSDDALWAKFKAAGDTLYAAKSERDAKDEIEFGANLQAKLELLTEAEKLTELDDKDAAREQLRNIQERWEAIGKVPRDKVRSVEDRLRKVESGIKKLEEAHWKQNDPEKKARSEGMVSQLESAIAKLEQELSEATSKGESSKAAELEEALKARRAWLAAIG